jgi:hypothetical protein
MSKLVIELRPSEVVLRLKLADNEAAVKAYYELKRQAEEGSIQLDFRIREEQ